MLVGNPRVSQLENDPMTWTVVVSGLTNNGSGGTPDEEAVALGVGLAVGAGVGMMQWGCVICCISPNTFTSSLKKESRKPFGTGSVTLI